MGFLIAINSCFYKMLGRQSLMHKAAVSIKLEHDIRIEHFGDERVRVKSVGRPSLKEAAECYKSRIAAHFEKFEVKSVDPWLKLS